MNEILFEEQLEMDVVGGMPPAIQATPVAAEDIELKPRLPDLPLVQAESALMESMDSIPDKMAFKIGEAADMVGVKQYVLRYWETEFDQLKPKKSKNGQRVYSRRDVETALMIKKLLYRDRFSIEGARAVLRGLKTQVKEERVTRTLSQKHDSAIEDFREFVADLARTKEIFI